MLYPVYFNGKKIGEWNPLAMHLVDLFKEHFLSRYPYASDYVCHLYEDKVIISLRAGDGG